MTPVYQEIKDFVNGDCMRACVASILEVPLNAIPNFMEAGEDYYLSKLRLWFADSGLLLVCILPSDRFLKDAIKYSYAIGTITSPRDSTKNHAVVVYGGKVVHDPFSNEEPLGQEYKGDPEVLVIMDIAKYNKWRRNAKLNSR